MPGQRRGYTTCTASSSDEGSGPGLTSPDLEEEVAVVGEDLTLVDDSDVEDHEAMDTIKRAVKSSTAAAPHRPPRVIDTRPSSSSATSTEYYNLCHPPPLDPVPTIPRRKPYISNPDLGTQRSATSASTWSERTCEPR